MKPRRLTSFTLAVFILLLATTQLAFAGPQIIWGPVLSDLTPTSIRISWRTNVPTRGQVVMEGLEQTLTPEGIYHEAQLVGLEPTRVDAHRKVVSAIFRTPRQFILHTGDIVSNGKNIQDWHKFFGVAGILLARVPMYTVLGNHERNSIIYYQMWPLPRGGGDYNKRWYSFTYGNCFFLALDSNDRLDEQVQWARRQLAGGSLSSITHRSVARAGLTRRWWRSSSRCWRKEAWTWSSAVMTTSTSAAITITRPILSPVVAVPRFIRSMSKPIPTRNLPRPPCTTAWLRFLLNAW